MNGTAPVATFVSFCLMVVLGVRFGGYAWRNRRANAHDAQRVLWLYCAFVGAAAALYGVVGIAEAVAGLPTAFHRALLLGFVLLVALTLREVNLSSALSNTERTREGGGFRRALEYVFVGVVLVVLVVAGFFGSGPVTTVLEAVGALAFVGYGLYHGHAYLDGTAIRGTAIDTLVRHFVAILTFAGVALAVGGIGVVAAADAVAEVHVVFVVMAATSLMTASIKLRQSLAARGG